MPSIRSAAVVLTTSALLAASLVPAQAAEAPGTTPAPAATYVGEVTLITGDRVTVRRIGTTLVPQVTPAAGRERMLFSTTGDGDRLLVVPADAQAGVSAGRLDRRLFDVGALVRGGYHDDRRADLPLLVGGSGVSALAGAATAAGATASTLSGLGIAAVRQPKDRVAELWPAIRSNGTGQVWLDGLRQPALDRSVVQVGAPAAWQAGHTGQGVTVAVLDTGIDSRHPDLRDRITGARNFTDESGTRDTDGHGTHVASTIAGSGAGSDGKYKGVAPGARILAGKVCAAYGCPESAILAGMDWAVRSGAKVVNLSLGGPDTAGLDPLEQAVQDLSGRHGTLFVIAAGNDGSKGDETIGSPASADAALAVGAVDRDDRVADFSSRGPRIHDAALKPEIVAPGVQISAARSGDSGGDPKALYTTMSGTSMATPHVAGAAAILAGQHPDWSGAQLKAALTGSAQPVDAGVYEQGAGRLDVGRAVAQSISTEPAAVSVGRQTWPHTDDPVVTRTVSYRNPSATAQVLALAIEGAGPDGSPAPDGMFTLSASSVTVPAGGQASVQVSVNTAVPAAEGAFGARITATGAAGVRVVTPVAVDREPESYDLTVRTIDGHGAPTTNALTFVWGVDVDRYRILDNLGGTAVLRVRRGTYHVDGTVGTLRADGTGDLAKLAAPDLAVTADTTVTVDARQAEPVSVDFDRPGVTQRLARVGYSRFTGERGVVTAMLGTVFERMRIAQLGGPAPAGELIGDVGGMWAVPDRHGDLERSPVTYNLTWFPADSVPGGFHRDVVDGELARVDTTYRSQSSHTRGTKVWAARDATQRASQGFGVPFPLPLSRTEFHNTDDGAGWTADFEQWSWVRKTIRYETVTTSGVADHQPGGRYTEDWNTAVVGPGLSTGDLWAYRTGDTLVLGIPLFSDAAPNHTGTSLTTSGRTALYRDGVLVGETARAGEGVYDVPAEPGRYRLETSATRDVSELSTRLSAVWTFDSERPPEVAPAGKGKGGVPLPLMAIRFAPPGLDATNTSSADSLAVPVTVERQPGATAAPLTALTVQQSLDDGQTWTPVPVTRTGDLTALATITHPNGARFVSLRATATDATGATLDQTIIRAYHL